MPIMKLPMPMANAFSIEAVSNAPLGKPASETRKSPESARLRIWMRRRSRFCSALSSGRQESSLKK